MSYLTRVPPLGIFRLVEGVQAAVYHLGLSFGGGATLGASQEVGFPFPACPLNGAVTQAQAELWFGVPGGTGFHLQGAINIVRPGSASIDVENSASQEYGREEYFPLDLSYNCRHLTGVADSLPICSTRWAYILFEKMPYWQDKPVQIELINFAPALFDPALGNGVQVWCADTPGTMEPTERILAGYSTVLYDWGTPPTGPQEPFSGDPVLLPQRRDLLLHAMGPADFPVSMAVPAGRALIICTGNQNPQTMPLGTNVFYDVAVGFQNPNPPGAYKTLRSSEPTTSNIWTVSAASQIKISSVGRNMLFGGTFDYSRGVLVYRDPAQLAGNTLRVPITAPYLWYIEIPAETFFGGEIHATFRAYAVSETELTGTPTQNFQVVKSWNWNDVQARLGAVLTEVLLVTSNENTFSSGAGSMDVNLTGGRQLVWYEMTAISVPGSPEAGLHPAALLHTNPSIF